MLIVLALALATLGARVAERWGSELLPIDLSRAGSGRLCTLDRILDGDSLVLVCGDETLEVRLRCIDAPEKDQLPWGNRSRAHLRRIATDRVELHPIETDRFGRTVAEIYTATGERRSLNLEQVKQGQAAVYPRYCEESRFFSAERKARDASLGIWSQPGDHQAPWTYRHRR